MKTGLRYDRTEVERHADAEGDSLIIALADGIQAIVDGESGTAFWWELQQRIRVWNSWEERAKDSADPATRVRIRNSTKAQMVLEKMGINYF